MTPSRSDPRSRLMSQCLKTMPGPIPWAKGDGKLVVLANKGINAKLEA
jgi:hypothetical protein